LVGPETDIDRLLFELSGHVALRRASRLVVRLVGRPGKGLNELLNRLCAMTSAEIELRLLSSEFFDVPRAGLTHSPGDFLFQPVAWAQMLDYFRLVASVPPRVRITVRTVSSRRWINWTVRLANLGSGLYGRALCARAGGGR